MLLSLRLGRGRLSNAIIREFSSPPRSQHEVMHLVEHFAALYDTNRTVSKTLLSMLNEDRIIPYERPVHPKFRELFGFEGHRPKGSTLRELQEFESKLAVTFNYGLEVVLASSALPDAELCAGIDEIINHDAVFVNEQWGHLLRSSHPLDYKKWNLGNHTVKKRDLPLLRALEATSQIGDEVTFIRLKPTEAAATAAAAAAATATAATTTATTATTATATAEVIAEETDVYMGQFPVTVSQFKRFVDAGGYMQQRYFHATPRHWEHCIRPTNRDAPDYWVKRGAWEVRYLLRSVPVSSVPDHPVTSVSLPEALAFAAWYEESLCDASSIAGRLRLPSETEWLAAAGYDNRCNGGHNGRTTGDRRETLVPYAFRHLDRLPLGQLLGEGGVMEPRSMSRECVYTQSAQPGAGATGSSDDMSIHNLVGNAWEMTTSSSSSGSGRGCILKGGSVLTPPRLVTPEARHHYHDRYSNEGEGGMFSQFRLVSSCPALVDKWSR